MTGYVLYCTVCEINYSSVHHCNRHLLGRSHQEEASDDLCSWDQEIKECAVVLYSSFPLTINNGHCPSAGAESVIQYFCKTGTIVTDFVMSTGSPRIGILQFESKRKVKQVISESGGTSILIDNQLVQVRRLVKLLDLEWENLYVNFQVLGKETCMTDHHLVPKDAVSLVFQQFQSIMKEMEIPDDEFNLVTEFIHEIKNVLDGEFSPERESKVELYRHNFLKLRNNYKSNIYLIFIHAVKVLDGKFEALFLKHLEPLWKLLIDKQTKNVSKILKNMEVQEVQLSEELHQLSEEDKYRMKFSNGRNRLIHKQSGLEFRFNCVFYSYGELQLSNLVKYYCEFDTRIKPLLTLLYYWAKVNDITIGREPDQDYITFTSSYIAAPDPVALEWFLIFFLIQNENMIPPPDDIIKCPYISASHSKSNKAKLDFEMCLNPEFCKNWKKTNNLMKAPLEGTEEFVLSVINLLEKFFKFYANTLPNSFVLNTREGKIHKFDDNDDNNINDIKILVRNPFVKNWKLFVSQEAWNKVVRPAMKKTGEKLEHYNASLKCMSSSTAQILSGGSLQESLCVYGN